VCIHRISTVGYRVVNVNGACNRSDNDGCSRTMPLGILVVSSLPRSYSTYNRDTGTVRKLITCPLRLRTRPKWQERVGDVRNVKKARHGRSAGEILRPAQRRPRAVLCFAPALLTPSDPGPSRLLSSGALKSQNSPELLC
jgi:hypothetical protein